MRLFGRKSNSDNSIPTVAEKNTSSKTDTGKTDTSQPTIVGLASAPKAIGERIMIPAATLEKSRRELKTLLFEKSLVSSALTRLYEAEAAGEITKDERELLAGKYRDQLKDLDGRIIKIDAFIEVGDLQILREQLVQLVQQKIESIERRIERTRPLAGSLLLEKVSAGITTNRSVEKPQVQTQTTKPHVPDISSLLSSEPAKPTVKSEPRELSAMPQVIHSSESIQEASIANRSSEEESPKRKRTEKALDESGDEVEELQQELREALDRLEKLDLET